MPGFEYAPAPESRSIVTIRSSYGLFINGEFVDGSSTRRRETIDPATEEPLAEVVDADATDVDTAVAAARTAFERVWSRLRGADRGKYLFRLARIIQERARELAVLESIDNGKPIRESRDVDLPLVAAHFFYYAGWADKLGYALPGRPDPGPIGVAGQIIPWNFPLLMLAWKVAPALACGNTVVLKPAETTPLTALTFAEICQQADLPPGVVNIVTGAGETGRALAAHPGVAKIAFTGSTEVGRRIARTIAGTGKRLTLELGGKAANIVFDDAPIDQAVEGIVNGIFFNQGHVCCAGSRLLVQESIAEELLARLRGRMALLRVGDPLDKNTDVGAINSAAQLARVRELVASGEAEGAARWSTPCELPPRGFWHAPTMFTGVSQSHRIAREEIFGPVLSVLTFRTPAEAVEKANNTPYGLSAGVWTEKGSRVLALANALRAGVVWANTFNKFDPTSPFGGYRESGLGREGGRHGLDAYLSLDPPEQPTPATPGAAAPATPGPAAPATPGLATPTTPGPAAPATPGRVPVRKTYKLYIGGAFPRSESGRSYPVRAPDGSLLANAALASRKDLRHAVRAARAATTGWAGVTAYLRGQILYRVAEMLEGRRAQFVAEVCAGEGTPQPHAESVVNAAIDRWVWYAGWTDKVAQVRGSVNPVAGPYFNVSVPQPAGVVGIVAPAESSLLGLVSVVAPVIATGNTCVVLASEKHPLPAVTLAEVLVTSDLPGGVVNLLTGRIGEICGWLAGHLDVDGIDLTGVGDTGEALALERTATENLKRVVLPPREPVDWCADPGMDRLLAFLETKTIWHPQGF